MSISRYDRPSVMKLSMRFTMRDVNADFEPVAHSSKTLQKIVLTILETLHETMLLKYLTSNIHDITQPSEAEAPVIISTSSPVITAWRVRL